MGISLTSFKAGKIFYKEYLRFTLLNILLKINEIPVPPIRSGIISLLIKGKF